MHDVEITDYLRTTGRPTPLVPPGEILLKDFLEPLGLSQYRLAHDLKVPPRRINEIVHGTRAITADTALRLSRYYGTTAQFWLHLLAGYELRRAEPSAKAESVSPRKCVRAPISANNPTQTPHSV